MEVAENLGKRRPNFHFKLNKCLLAFSTRLTSNINVDIHIDIVLAGNAGAKSKPENPFQSLRTARYRKEARGTSTQNAAAATRVSGVRP